MADEPDERKKALQALTVAQLKGLADAFGVDLKPEEADPLKSLFVEQLKGKDLYVDRLYRAKKKVSLDAIRAAKIGDAPKQVEGGQPAPKKPEQFLTPTLAPQKTATMVSFDEVVGYLEQYRFISRYSEESSYEIELAGSLRERFGTIIRQNPVAVPGRRLAIDLDVGGIGIELKFNATATILRNAAQQLADYKLFYGDRLVFLCIGTPGLDQYKNDIRNVGVVFIEK